MASKSKSKMVDLTAEGGEMLLAQKLASGEPANRQRAMRHLSDWLRAHANNAHDLPDDILMRLWKGLYFCVWMQDKPLLQEALVDELCVRLPSVLVNETQRLQYTRAAWRTLTKEWLHIDKWRLDKFMMLCRRLLRSLLQWWQQSNKPEQYVKQLNEELLQLRNFDSQSLSTHLVSVYLDELDLMGSNAGLSELPLTMLHPVMNCLQHKHTTDLMFETILKEVYESLLLDYVQRMEEASEHDEQTDDTQPTPLTVDYGQISQCLMSIGAQPEHLARRRKMLYHMAKRFSAAAKGLDPFDDERPQETENKLSKRDIAEAAGQLTRQLKVQKRKKTKRKAQDNGEGGETEAFDSAQFTDELPKKKKKSTPKKQKVDDHASPAVTRARKSMNIQKKKSPAKDFGAKRKMKKTKS